MSEEKYWLPPGKTEPELNPNYVEPEAEASELKGKLPDDFPHKSILEEAGINTYAQARKAQEAGWADVDGIGEARAAEIAEALGSEPAE